MSAALAPPPHLTREAWRQVQRRLLAKALGELSYEEALHPVAEAGAGAPGGWRLELPGGVCYRFHARRGIWGQLVVEPGSVLREAAGGAALPAEDCAQLFIDAREALGLDGATLSHYLRELHQTALADTRLVARRAGLGADALLDLPPERLQCLLDGHPKAPASKGRLGWGDEDQRHYAPESLPELHLVWLAVRREDCRLALAPGLTEATLWQRCLGADGHQALHTALAAAGLDAADSLPLPVHPWQWDNVLVPAFARAIAERRIVPLPFAGDRYLPQASLRTLTNVDAPERLNVKLALSILNTSCYRGIPGRYLEAGPVLSRWLAERCAEDPLLSATGTVVLEELAGAFVPHPDFAQVPDAPYQFHETLGAIWRESVVSRLADGETAVMLGALLQRAEDGTPLVRALIARSGLAPEAWLARLFEAVVVPLYHLMCRYGVGLVAHGQNLTLVLREHVPVRVALKDLQGDCRLVDRDLPELDGLPEAARSALTRLPPEYLLHDLYTGHFVTVLRFLSELLAEKDGLPELRFYAVLARVLRAYQQAHPELAERFSLFDLFRPTMPRVCVNRARFKVGYGDSAQRPLPELGTPLTNPLAEAERTVHGTPLRPGALAS